MIPHFLLWLLFSKFLWKHRFWNYEPPKFICKDPISNWGHILKFLENTGLGRGSSHPRYRFWWHITNHTAPCFGPYGAPAIKIPLLTHIHHDLQSKSSQCTQDHSEMIKHARNNLKFSSFQIFTQVMLYSSKICYSIWADIMLTSCSGRNSADRAEPPASDYVRLLLQTALAIILFSSGNNVFTQLSQSKHIAITGRKEQNQCRKDWEANSYYFKYSNEEKRGKFP